MVWSEPIPMWDHEQMQSVEALLSQGQVTAVDHVGSEALLEEPATDN